MIIVVTIENNSSFIPQDLEDEWNAKAPDLKKMNSRGNALCNLIVAVTSTAKSWGVKSGMLAG